MIHIQRFINQLMSSNCYIVYDESSKRGVVIDPASKKSENEIAFIEQSGLTLDFILLTHEHTDHNWGVNSLREKYSSARLVCTDVCEKNIAKTNKAYFLFYYNDPNYTYEIAPADIVIKDNNECLIWYGNTIEFIKTPGHSFGSACILIGKFLFTGDTIMTFTPYFNKRDSNQNEWKKSVDILKKRFGEYDVTIYPGHGESFNFNKWNYI